jgi:hypothetical protein
MICIYIMAAMQDQLGTGQAANADEPGLIRAALEDVGAIPANR